MSPRISEGITTNEPTPNFDIPAPNANGEADPADISRLSDHEVKLALLDSSNVVSNTIRDGLVNGTEVDKHGQTAAERAEIARVREEQKASPLGQELAREAAEADERELGLNAAAEAYVTERALGYLTLSGREAMALMSDAERDPDEVQQELQLEQVLAYETLINSPHGRAALDEAIEDGSLSTYELDEIASNAALLQGANERIMNAQDAQAANEDRAQAAERMAAQLGVDRVMASVEVLKASGADIGSWDGEQLAGAIRAQDALLNQSVKAARDAAFKQELMGTSSSKYEGLEINGKPVQPAYVAKPKAVDMQAVIALLDSPPPSRAAAIRAAVGNPTVVDKGRAEVLKIAGQLHEASKRKTAMGR